MSTSIAPNFLADRVRRCDNPYQCANSVQVKVSSSKRNQGTKEGETAKSNKIYISQTMLIFL